MKGGTFRGFVQKAFPCFFRKPKTVRIELPDPELKHSIPEVMRAYNRAERQRAAHMKWFGRATRKVGNAIQMLANRKNSNRTRRKLAFLSKRKNRIIERANS